MGPMPPLATIIPWRLYPGGTAAAAAGGGGDLRRAQRRGYPRLLRPDSHG